MLSISILERTENSILYELPPGKPNPKEKCSVGKDNRGRVFQSASKNDTCWYFTFNFIRKRIGHFPSEELLKERKIEKLCSQRRKDQTAQENSLPAIAGQLQSEVGLQALGWIDRTKAMYLIANKEISQPLLENSSDLEGYPSLFPFIEEFVKDDNCENMHEFLLKKKLNGRIQINLNFLRELEISVLDLFTEEISNKNGYAKIEWKTLDLITKSGFLDFFTRHTCATAYGLKKSSWKPLDGCESLIKELKEHGPLFVGGSIGRPAYIDEPFKMSQQLSGRDIYAWKPGAKRHKNIGHAVLLIGARKIQDKAHVYFIDPTDPSDPKDKSKQKIYMISYGNLTSNIFDLHGRPKQDSPVNYAYYGSFKI